MSLIILFYDLYLGLVDFVMILLWIYYNWIVFVYNYMVLLWVYNNYIKQILSIYCKFNINLILFYYDVTQCYYSFW